MGDEIKAVIWDMGGVLLREVDPKPRELLAAQYGVTIEKLYELVFTSRSAKLASLGTKSEDEHWEWVAGEVGVNRQNLDDFRERFWAGDRVDPQLTAFITSLREKYQTALLSNAWDTARKVLKERYHCLDIFDQVIISAEVRLAKPNPEIYKAMLNLLGVSAQQAIFVDDLQENVDAAKELGIHAFLFQGTSQAIEDVDRLLARNAP